MNRNYSVHNQRNNPKSDNDFFPTPAWATRALYQYILKNNHNIEMMSCLEPACGKGHMAKPLKEFFKNVDTYDINDYGYGEISNFLIKEHDTKYDFIITNPPFKIANEFVIKAFDIAKCGIAIFERTTFIEGKSRYNILFSKFPPTIIAPFSERVPIHKNFVKRKASTATSYSWFYWNLEKYDKKTEFVWIPPCRKLLEKDEDYDF